MIGYECLGHLDFALSLDIHPIVYVEEIRPSEGLGGNTPRAPNFLIDEINRQIARKATRGASRTR